MPFTKEKLERLEKLLTRVDLPFQKKSGLERNVNRVIWIRDNFDIRNSKNPKREEIMKLIQEILDN